MNKAFDTAAIETCTSNPAPDQSVGASGRNHPLHQRVVERVIQAMREHLPSPIDNRQFAEIACLSPYHFNRIFHRLAGIPPIQFQYALRLHSAKNLLLTTNLSITDICYEVGYNSLGTFTSRFTKQFGMAPGTFRCFAKEVGPIRLDELVLPVRSSNTLAVADVTGALHFPGDTRGVAFVGAFERGIPEGRPVACSLTNSSFYRLSVPAKGQWQAFALAAPWNATLADLLAFKGILQGRSGVLTVERDHWLGTGDIHLSDPSSYDPPILLNIPMLVAHWSARPNKTGQSASTGYRIGDKFSLVPMPAI